MNVSQNFALNNIQIGYNLHQIGLYQGQEL